MSNATKQSNTKAITGGGQGQGRGKWPRIPKLMDTKKSRQIYEHRIVSFKIPWPFILGTKPGTKRTENRNFRMNEHEGEWIGIHVSNRFEKKQDTLDLIENELIHDASQKANGG